MAPRNNLRNWTLFANNGARLEGAHEYTGPDMSIIVTDIRTGAMDTSLPHDDGMEPMKASFKIYGIDPDVLAWFGFQPSGTLRLTAYEGYVAPGVVRGKTDEIEGMVTKITPDARPNSASGEASLTVEVSLTYYKSTYNGRELFEIDPINFRRRVNGRDVLDDMASAIRVR